MNITQLIPFLEQCKGETKIHFATSENDAHIDAFRKGEFRQWQEIQTQRNFERHYILSLLSIGNGEWLFAGLYETFGCEEKDGGFVYETGILDAGAEFVGRLVVRFEKYFRESYVYAEKYIDEMTLVEIKRESECHPDEAEAEILQIVNRWGSDFKEVAKHWSAISISTSIETLENGRCAEPCRVKHWRKENRLGNVSVVKGLSGGAWNVVTENGDVEKFDSVLRLVAAGWVVD